MLRSLAFVVIGAGCVGSELGAEESSAPLPHWVARAAAEGTQPPSLRLATPFSVRAAPHSATIRFAADFCSAVIELNGRRVADVEPYGPTIDLDVLPVVASGDNELTISVTPVEGPTAVALSLSDGKVMEVIT